MASPLLREKLHRRLARFTDEQREAITELDLPVALTAAAGSGKTSVLVERYLHLLARGLAPHEILSVTFTNEAADEMRKRIVALLRELEEAEDLITKVETSGNMGTLHSFCYRVLNQFGSHLGLPPIESILSPFDFATSFDRAYRAWLGKLTSEELHLCLSHYSLAELRAVVKSIFFNERTFFQHAGNTLPWLASFAELIKPLCRTLTTEFRGKGLYTFDELETFALQILTDVEEARTKLATQFQAICVDEFQDTSQIQWAILQTLLNDNLNKLFVVGDPKQSIYRFRKADVKVFYAARETMLAHQGRSLSLTANFRTDSVVLEPVNQISAGLFADASFQPMVAGRRSSVGKFEVYRYRGERGSWAENEVHTVCGMLSSRFRTGWKPEETAILFRVSDRIPQYFEALSHHGFSVVAKRTGELFGNLEARDVYHYLKAMQKPENNFHLAAFLCSAYVGFTYQTLFEISQRPGDNLFERLAGSWHRESLGWLFSLIEGADRKPLPLLEALFHHTGKAPLDSEPLFALLGPLLEDDITLAEAIEKMESWEREGISFSSEVASAKSSGIRLMTVHGAKGLEFKNVLLVDNLRQSPRRYGPLLFSKGKMGIRYRENEETTETEDYTALSEAESLEDREESKRILYVALTRARDTLTVFLPEIAKGAPKECWGTWLEDLLQGERKPSGK